ncbi:MAG: glucosaminidase domain-containing protein [Candidatus Diapherotrites archaeon]|nr:glucosaminidase domain-containing protein [Candidatus Diapherotrites archaeon]
MGIGNLFSGIYTKLEDGFFGIMDFFEKKGIPVYNYTEFLEGKGIPAFPFTVGALVFLIMGAWLLFFSSPASVFLTVNFQDDARNSLNDVSFSITNAKSGMQLYYKPTNSDTKIELKGVDFGTKLSLMAQKEGFENAPLDLTINESALQKSFTLNRIAGLLTAKIRLVDSVTGDTIKNAAVFAEVEDKKIAGTLNNDGSWSFIGVPEGKPIRITVKADGYLDSAQSLNFDSENASTVKLVASSTGANGLASITFRVFDNETRQLIDGVLIKVFEKDSTAELSSDIAVQGELLEQIGKGKSIKWVASKEGYATFDSTAGEADFLTLRNDAETVNVFLEAGGKTISVTAIDKESSNVLSEALITLFNARAEKVDANMTGFGGFVEFKDLNSESGYYISAFKDGYLPVSQKIFPKTSPTFRLEMERSIAGNAANAAVFTIDSKESPVANAALTFFEQTTSDLLPFGMPDSFTDVAGYYGSAFKAGTNLYVKASKDTATGDGNAILDAGSLNRIEIQIAAPSEIIELTILDENGNPINEGNVKITTDSGTVLFDGNISNAKVVFDSLGNKSVKVHVELPDGKTFDESLALTGAAMQELRIGQKENNGLAPEIRLLRLESLNGETVEGLVKGQEGFLVFETVWPEGEYKGGIHVRVGSDGIKNAESQEIAITGFNAEVQNHFYGRTYNASPKPGNETIDFLNKGSEGKANKFVELYFDKPKGTKIIKIQARLSDAAALKQEVHFRAWSLISSQFYRTPTDSTLALAEFNNQKLGLYAETSNEEITVFNAEQSSCSKELCASFKFLDAGFNSFEAKDFKAVKGNVYALEVALSGKDTLNAVLNASTNRESPKIGFQGSDIEVFTEIPDTNSQDTGIQVKDITVEKGKETKARIYFKALAVGNSSIALQVTGKSSKTENFAFNIFEEKIMKASFNPLQGEAGKNFSVILNSADGEPVENATIIFKDSVSGNEVFRILGSAWLNKGKYGKYLVKGVFKAGLYTAEITAPGFRPLSASYTIASPGVLELPAELEIRIPSAAKTATAELVIKNNSSKEISNLIIEAIKPKGFDGTFVLDYTAISSMMANSTETMQLTASYNGTATTAHTTVQLQASGIQGDSIPVTATTKVNISYNQKLDSSCLTINPASLQATLYYNPMDSSQNNYSNSQYSNLNYNQGYSLPTSTGSRYSNYYPQSSGQYNSNYYSGYNQSYYPQQQNNYNSGFSGSARQIQVQLTNNCEEELNLIAKVKSQVENSGIRVTVPDTDLQKGESKTIIVDIENTIGQAFYSRSSSGFDIEFNADQLSKSIPLTVNLQSIQFAIQAPDTLNIYASSGIETSTPLFVSNIGNTAIQNLSFQIGSGYGEGIELRLVPERSYLTLPPGQSVYPPALVVVKADVDKSKVLRQIIDIKGTIDGKEYTLKTVNVFIHASAPSCLQVSPKEVDMIEEMTGQGAKTTEITISNFCLEEVRITDIEPKTIGTNQLALIAGPAAIPVNGKAKIQLRLLKKDEIDTTSPLIFYGALIRSGKRIQTEPINLTVKLGKTAADSAEGVTSAQAEIPTCEDATKKKTVKFPKIASGKDCSNGYCDADQLADFLAEKIAKKVSEAQQATLAKGKSTQYCTSNPRACSFSELGVKPETYTIYFQNDLLSPELLQAKLSNDAFASVKISQVIYRDIKEGEPIIEAVGAGTGFAGQIRIPQFRSCGKYSIRIDGAVDVIAGQIQSGREKVGVILLGKKDTAECDAKIQNFQNFLPADSTLSYASNKSSWLGTVDSTEAGLEDSAKEIAQGLFGKPDRFVQNSSTNKLLLGKKSITQGIVEISLGFNGIPTAPVTVDAFINENALASEAKKKEFLKEAVRAINGLKSNAPAKGSCITADEKTLRITSASESFGELQISSCIQEFEKQTTNSTAVKPQVVASDNLLKIFANTPSCCAFTISGNLANQRIGVNVEKPQDLPDYIDWQQTFITADKTNKKPLAPEDRVFLVSKTIAGKKEKANITELMLCTKGTKSFANAGNNSITIKAFDTTNLGVKQFSTTSEVKLSACAIHPQTQDGLFAKLTALNLKDGEKKEFYFVPSWKNPPNPPEGAKVGDIIQGMEIDEKLRPFLNGKHFYDPATGINSEDSTAGNKEIGRIEGTGLAGYTVACIATHVSLDLLGALVTLGGSIVASGVSTGIDCGVPLVFGMIDLGMKRFSDTKNPILSALDSILQGFKNLSYSGLKALGIAKEGDQQKAGLFGAGVSATVGEQTMRGIIPLIKSWIGETVENPPINPVAPDNAISGLKEYQAAEASLAKLKKAAPLTIQGVGTRPTRSFKSVSELKTELSRISNDPTLNWDRTYIDQLNNAITESDQFAPKIAEAETKLQEAARKASGNVDAFANSAGEEIKKIDELLKKGGLSAKETTALETAREEMLQQLKLLDSGTISSRIAEIDSKLATMPAGSARTALEAEKKTLKSRLGTITKIEGKGVAGASSRTNLSKLITESSNTKVGAATIKTVSQSKFGQWASFWKASKTGKTLRFGGSILNGVLANAAGYLVYTKTVQNMQLKNLVTVDEKGNKSWDFQLVKNQAYKVVVSKSKGKSEAWDFSIIEPSKAPANAEWLQNCDGSYNETELKLYSPTGTAASPAAVTPGTELKVTGQPSITAEKIDKILARANSPAKGTGKTFYAAGLRNGIDPAIALAFFKAESQYGLDGMAVKTKAIGNIKFSSACPTGKFETRASDNAKFCKYNSWEQGIEDWFKLIKNSSNYVAGGNDTVEKIATNYVDKDNSKYASDIKGFVSEIRAA